MSYLVLARKFRPQTFASIAGQEHITKALSNAIVRNKVAHALLFTGPRGVGKTTMARVFARALNCTGNKQKDDLTKLSEADARLAVEPCGECPNCKEIARSGSIAVWEIDGASNNSVDNVRELIESLRSMPPAGSVYKVYIIDEVHMLSTAAFNALLKSLEEPPPNTIFIFATTEPHKIPETVISRCQQHDFRRLPNEVISNCLKDIAKVEEITADDQVFDFIARKSQGGMRDAQSMLDRLSAFSAEKIDLATALQVFGVVDHNFFFSLSRAVMEKEVPKTLELINEAFNQSIDLRTFVEEFLTHFRNLLLVAVNLNGKNKIEDARLIKLLNVTKSDLAQYQEQVKLAESGSFDFQRLFDLAEQCANGALLSNFPRYVIEAGVTKMATLSSLRPVAEIISRLENGELKVPASEPVYSAEKKTSKSENVVAKSTVVSEKSQNISVPDFAPEYEQESEEQVPDPAIIFNPQWQDFVHHVKSRKEVLLSTFLRRVYASKFSLGVLEIQAVKFDLETISNKDYMQSLKACLHSYSGHADWNVILKEKEETASASSDSIATIEKKAEQERIRQMDKEARNEPLVKSALAKFSGSKIERVNVIKR